MSNLNDFAPIGYSIDSTTQTSNSIDYGAAAAGAGTTISIGNHRIIKLTSTYNGTDPAYFQLGSGSFIGQKLTFIYDRSATAHSGGSAMWFYSRVSSSTKETATVGMSDGVVEMMWAGTGWSYCNDWQG
jgi:hypothetical protein